MFLLIFSLSSMMSAQWSSSLSVAYLLIQEIFKDFKKLRASMKFIPPSAFEPYKIFCLIPFPFPDVRVDQVLTKLRINILIVSFMPSLGSSAEAT